ncbi:MAG: succinylglutamate desuccinylase/aspartoacylase family protein [Myxococcota bacterium]|nr:succinylglutamate desuccinylase/aspartoacylase family protein [Myxococcota bacterium]
MAPWIQEALDATPGELLTCLTGDGIEGITHMKSDEEGPHIYLSGSLHGNEPVGAQVLYALHRARTRGPLIHRGQLTLLLGNPAAFEVSKRYLEEDLNRAFVHSPRRNSEGRRALELRGLLRRSPPSFLLDFHSVSSDNSHIVVYREESRHWAEELGCFPTHFCYAPEHMAGRTLIDEVINMGRPALVLECGRHGEPAGIAAALAHIDRLLDHFSLKPEGAAPLAPPLVQGEKPVRFRTVQSIRPGPEFRFSCPVETGYEIQPGERFAEDLFGAHVAASRCWLMMPSLVVGPHDADAGWLCEKEQVGSPPLSGEFNRAAEQAAKI